MTGSGASARPVLNRPRVALPDFPNSGAIWSALVELANTDQPEGRSSAGRW